MLPTSSVWNNYIKRWKDETETLRGYSGPSLITRGISVLQNRSISVEVRQCCNLHVIGDLKAMDLSLFAFREETSSNLSPKWMPNCRPVSGLCLGMFFNICSRRSDIPDRPTAPRSSTLLPSRVKPLSSIRAA